MVVVAFCLTRENMAVGIQQLQPATEVLQADAGTALVLVGIFREIAVADGTDDPLVLLMDVQVDERRFVIAHLMLERILDQRDEKERSYGC